MMQNTSKCARRGLLLATASVATPLVLIGLSALLSEKFSLYSNALSDLGHAAYSNVAWVFNLGLSLGGLLMAVFAIKYVSALNKAISYLTLIAGYVLILIAVYDESYGRLHFWVSVVFFVLILLLVLVYASLLKSTKMLITALALVVVNVILWASHFAVRTPPGAAIPELVSIFTVIPFYIHLAGHSVKRVCEGA